MTTLARKLFLRTTLNTETTNTGNSVSYELLMGIRYVAALVFEFFRKKTLKDSGVALAR